jgi:hypothetical protein
VTQNTAEPLTSQNITQNGRLGGNNNGTEGKAWADSAGIDEGWLYLIMQPPDDSGPGGGVLPSGSFRAHPC